MLLTPGLAGASSHPAFRMPDLVGRSRLAVYRTMRHDGLYFVTHGPGSSDDRWNDVVSQSPAPGDMVRWHSEASLSVRPGPPTAHAERVVPRLTGRSRAAVYAAMKSAALYFSTVGPGSSNGTWKMAVAQSPRAGTKVPWHSTVVVHVTTRAPVVETAAKKSASPEGGTSTATNEVVSGANFKLGVATWYSYVPGQCATWYLPKGTVITVLDLATGRSITCTITDRDSDVDNHIVDLDAAQFAELEPLAKGLISVKVSW
ncbi:MAG TPA: PASTA domain-containing protein [Acidimicrobiales bacterium]|nr:PASTA domain-containing protein [Acidimicrobiales bacterium]